MEFPKELEDNIRDILIEVTDDGVDLEVNTLDGGFFVKTAIYPSLRVDISSSISLKIEDITESLIRLDLFCKRNDCIVAVLSAKDKNDNNIYNSSIGIRSNKILSFIEFNKTGFDERNLPQKKPSGYLFSNTGTITPLKEDIYHLVIGISYIND